MDVSYIEHLLNKAKHRFKVFVTPNHEISSWTIDRLYDLLKENKTKKLKSVLASIELYNMADTLALASFYDHCLVEGKKREARWVRHCFSGKEKVNFLGPIDGIRGNLEGLKQIATSLDCCEGKIKHFHPTLPVAHALLSKDPKTIRWCLSTFFRAKNLPYFTFKSQAPQPNRQNVLMVSPLASSTSGVPSNIFGFFEIVLQENDPLIQKEMLSCVQHFPCEKVVKNFALFWSTELLKVAVSPSSHQKQQAIQEIKKVVASVCSQKWSNDFLVSLLENIDATFYRHQTPQSKKVDDILKTLRPLFGKGFTLPENNRSQKNLTALLFAITENPSFVPKSLGPLSANDEQNMSPFAKTIYNTHMVKHALQQNLIKNQSASPPKPANKKKM